MWIQSLDQSSSQIMDAFLRILPVGIVLGVAIVFLLRLARYVRRRLSERVASAGNVGAGLGETVSGIVASISGPTTLLVIDILLFLYLLFHYEWAPAYAQLKASWPYLLLFLGAPHMAAMFLIKAVGPFVIAASFFGLLGGCLVMGRFYVGPWPRRFQLGCVAVFVIALAWLSFRWGQTGWNLAQAFSTDTPKGLQSMLIAALFSACSRGMHHSDPINAIGPSIGMSMLESLAAIYLAEKYLRLALFHARQDDRGSGRWVRMVPIVPMLLVGAFIGYGIWEDVQRARTIAEVADLEATVLTSKVPHLLWHEAVAQCAAQGPEWRLPTQHEIHFLSQGPLATDIRLGAAWSAELHPVRGAEGFRWKGKLPKRPPIVASMSGRCLSPQPTDLYQRLVVALYPELYQQHHGNGFYHYFFPGEVIFTQAGIYGGLPEAVLCVKSTAVTEAAAAGHLMKDAILVREPKAAAALLDELCENKAYASGFCNELTAKRMEAARENDPVQLARDFETRQEKCRQTSDPEVCAGQGWYYRVRGEFDKAALFYDWSCKKGFGNACLDKDQLTSEQQRFAQASDKLVQMGLLPTAPVRHREAKEPLILGCNQGETELCLYRGMIAEWEYKQQDARDYYAKGCAAGLLVSCTREVLMERHFTMAQNIDRDIPPKFVALCKKKEPLACKQAGSFMMSDQRDEKVRQQGEKLLADACAAGVPEICEYHKELTRPARIRAQDELDADTLRTASSYDIDRLREECSGSPGSCRGIVNQLSLQGQFKAAEWFAKAACDHERRENLEYCYQRIPYRQLFQGLSQTLIQKKYIKRQPEDHASTLPAMKKACQEGVVQSCSYLGMLMYDSMTGIFAGSHPLYSLAGLARPYQDACKFGDASACKRVLDLGRDWREGRYYAEKEQSRRPATVEETKAYGRLCEERNYAGACWEVLQPWLEDRKQDHRLVPEHLAPAWRYTEGLCEKGKDEVACWTLLKPSIDALEHDHSKLPTDRSGIRRLLERICKIEAEEQQEDKRACRELQRYLDLHWL